MASFFPLIPFLLFFIYIWAIIDTIRLMRPNGKLKRGIPIWRQKLTKEQVEDLRSLSQDKITYSQIGIRFIPSSFVRVTDHEALINPLRKNWRTSLPTLGYVRLDQDAEESWLYYRASLPMLLFMLPFLPPPGRLSLSGACHRDGGPFHDGHPGRIAG